MKPEATIQKAFDCIEYVRCERDRINRHTSGKAPREIVAYFKRHSQKAVAKSSKMLKT